MLNNKVFYLMKGAVILSLLFFCSCAEERVEEKKFRTINEEKKVDAGLARLDKEILSLSDSGLSALAEKYEPEDSTAVNLVELYTREILHIGPAKSPEAQSAISQFKRVAAYKEFMEDCDSAFVSMEGLKDELDWAFSILNSNIEGFNAPKEYAFYMGGFYSNVATTDRHLCFGLEFYLGNEYKNYKYVDGLYDYLIYNYRPKMMAVDGVRGWLQSEYLKDEMVRTESATLLDAMLYEGIITFAVSVALEDAEMADILGYKKEQYEWCEANEREMWNYLAENKQLFSTDRLTISKYVEPAPNTAYFPDDSPGRSGWYVGYKIVSSYMKNNPNATLGDLFRGGIDSRNFLQMSRYNP